MAAAWAALVAYGSLVPLNFNAAAPNETINLLHWLLRWITSPQWITDTADHVSSLGNSVVVTDLVLNLGLYVPAGIFLRLWFWQQRWCAAWQIVAAILVVASMTWVLECTQGLMPMRIASLYDVCCNTLGGAAGAIIAVRLRWGVKKVTFAAYRVVAHVVYDLRQFLASLGRRPGLMFAVVAVNIGMITFWSMNTSPSQSSGSVNWLPFAHHVSRSYDVAALQIGRSLLLYAAVASVLTIPFLTGRQRGGVGAVLILAALVAGLREFYAGGTAHGIIDITEPIIAVLAVAMMYSTAHLLVHAVRTSCQRRTQVPVAFERRRRPHDFNGGNDAAAQPQPAAVER